VIDMRLFEDLLETMRRRSSFEDLVETMRRRQPSSFARRTFVVLRSRPAVDPGSIDVTQRLPVIGQASMS
jgi:hypothetical protein